jgi:hypothetical protein
MLKTKSPLPPSQDQGEGYIQNTPWLNKLDVIQVYLIKKESPKSEKQTLEIYNTLIKNNLSSRSGIKNPLPFRFGSYRTAVVFDAHD